MAAGRSGEVGNPCSLGQMGDSRQYRQPAWYAGAQTGDPRVAMIDYAGSFRPEWRAWLGARSGKPIVFRQWGAGLKPLCAASGP